MWPEQTFAYILCILKLQWKNIYFLPADIFLYLKSTAVTFLSLSYLFFRSISKTVFFRAHWEKETKWFLNIGKFRQHLISHLEIAIVLRLLYSARIRCHYLMAAYRNVVDWNLYIDWKRHIEAQIYYTKMILLKCLSFSPQRIENIKSYFGRTLNRSFQLWEYWQHYYSWKK